MNDNFLIRDIMAIDEILVPKVGIIPPPPSEEQLESRQMTTRSKPVYERNLEEFINVIKFD